MRDRSFTYTKLNKANPRIQRRSTFHVWAGKVYIDSIVIGIRRQLDMREDSVSFARLLSEIQKVPQVLCRENYVSLCKRGGLREEAAHEDFDSLAGQGKPHLEPTMVKADQAQLMDKAKRLKWFATKRIAHIDEPLSLEMMERGARDLWGLPEFQQLDDCLDFMEQLLKKYLRLFRAKSFDILPVWNYDWKAIFREPWIPPNSG